MFDPNVYAQLAAIDPAAAAQYLASTSAPQAAAHSAPPAVFTPPPAVGNYAPSTAAVQPGIAQGFAQAQAAPPQQQAARGTLEEFFNQSTGGGGPSVTSKFFNLPGKPQGSWLQLTVLYDVTNADVQHDKTPQGVLKYFQKNGQDDLTRPKLVLVVKVEVTGSSDGTHAQAFPDGVASLWLKKGPVTDNLVRAMTAAGDPSGYPKAGATMIMQSAGEQASRTVGYSATKLYDFQYAAPAQDLQAIAQAASGFPTAAPVISTPTAAPAAALPSPTAPTPAPPATAAATLPTPPVPAVPVAGAVPAATTGVSAPPAPAPSLIPDDPKAAERAALLAKLQGLSS